MTNPHTDSETLTSAVMTYDADNRLATYNGKEIKYDADGNMTYGCLNGRMVYLNYDCRNRLICVKDHNGTTLTRYEYDAENIRTAVIEGNSRTVYVTDREAPYSQILTATACKEGILTTGKQTAQTLYTYGLGLISEHRTPQEAAEEENYYYHYNHLGSTTAVTDNQGTITYRFAYDTYGELTDIRDADYHSLKNIAENEGYTKEQLAQAIGIPFLYNGQYGVQTDANGLYYMRARYYSQDIKRFINRDVVTGSITNSQSLNRYSYVQGNPVKLTDPFGLCPDSNSNFRNFLYGISGFDWKAAGHAALDVAGIFWDGADLINAGWYALEGDVKSAAISLTCALPGVGMGAGVKLMKGGKYVEAGKAIYTISRATAGGIGIGAGISIAKTNGTNFFNALSEGRFDAPSFGGMLFGGVLAYASGKTFSTSIKSLSPETAARASKSSITKDSGELSGRPVEMPVYKGRPLTSEGTGLKMNLQFFASGGSRTPNKLLLGEGDIGTYRELLKAGKRGDNITPHHMPSAGYMSLRGVSRNDGLCMNMEMPSPGTGGRHRMTATYGGNMTEAQKAYYYSLSPRDALAYDISNLRQIYMDQGLYSEMRPKLQAYIKKYKSYMPEMFEK